MAITALDAATRISTAETTAEDLAERLARAADLYAGDPTPANGEQVNRAIARYRQDQQVRQAPRMEPRQIAIADARHPPIEHFIVGPLFPFGKASLLWGPQGAGKSAVLSQLVFKVAGGGGGAFLGMRMHDDEGGPVLVVTAEDTFDDWKRKAAAALHSCPDLNIERALERLHIIDKTEGIAKLAEVVQVRTDLGDESITRHEPRPTAERVAIIEHARRLGVRLVVIETASRLVEDETNTDFVAIMAACGHIAAETGAAVVLSHHPNKEAAKNNDSSPEGVRGGSALVNNSRTAVSLFYASSEQREQLAAEGMQFSARDVLVLEHKKSTSSVRPQDAIVLVRAFTPHGGVLQLPAAVAADPAQAEAHAHRLQNEQRAVQGQLAALYDLVAELKPMGKVSPSKLREGYRARLGLAKHDVESFVLRAIRAGVLTVLQRDKSDRVLDLGLGKRPTDQRFDARATAGDPEHGKAE